MTKLLSFFELLAYVLGSIGGFGCCLYMKTWVLAIAVVVLAGMAFPEAKEAYKRMMA